VLKLQSGRILYFARAVILSVYGDFPAGTIVNRIFIYVNVACTCDMYILYEHLVCHFSVIVSIVHYV
jgi:hypothetical protein